MMTLSLTHSLTLTHTHTRSDLQSWSWHSLYIIYNIPVLLCLCSEHESTDCLYKTASVAWYQFKLVPAQHSSSLHKQPSFPQNTWVSPSYQHAHSNRLSLAIRQSICTSALYNPLSSCYISFPHPQSICIICLLLRLCWVTKVQHSRNVNSLVIGPSSHSSSLHRSFWILVPLQHCSRTTDRFVCFTLSGTHGCVGLSASLQQHVQRVHHACTQICWTARCQQGAEFEGFGDTILVDICQYVLISLATKDDLGVVVVKVDLWR